MPEQHGTLADSSAIPWLGPLPERWTMMRGKDLFVQAKKPVLQSDETVTCFRDGTVTLRRNRRLTGYTEAVDFSGWQGVDPGDLVIHQMDGFAGAIGVSDSRGRCSPVYAVCIPRGDVDPRYFAHVLRYMAKRGWIAALSRGIRERSTDFRFKVFANQLLPLPPIEEQRLIVRFLDHKEVRIARAVQAQVTLRALLLERRSALVDELVLPGVRAIRIPNTRDLPPGWGLLRAKHLWNSQDVRSASGAEPRLTVSAARGVVPRESGEVTMFEAASYVGHKVVQPGDLVINSLWAWAGGMGVSSHAGLVSPAYGVYRLAKPDDHSSEYFHHLLRSSACQWQFQVQSKGIWRSRLQLRDDAFFNIGVPVPPLDVQNELVGQISRVTEDVDRAVESIDRKISLLGEYRTRLIADVVTGKMDVRAEAAALPEIDPEEIAEAQAIGGTEDNELEVAHAD